MFASAALRIAALAPKAPSPHVVEALTPRARLDALTPRARLSAMTSSSRIEKKPSFHFLENTEDVLRRSSSRASVHESLTPLTPKYSATVAARFVEGMAEEMAAVETKSSETKISGCNKMPTLLGRRELFSSSDQPCLQQSDKRASAKRASRKPTVRFEADTLQSARAAREAVQARMQRIKNRHPSTFE